MKAHFLSHTQFYIASECVRNMCVCVCRAVFECCRMDIWTWIHTPTKKRLDVETTVYVKQKQLRLYSMLMCFVYKSSMYSMCYATVSSSSDMSMACAVVLCSVLYIVEYIMRNAYLIVDTHAASGHVCILCMEHLPPPLPLPLDSVGRRRLSISRYVLYSASVYADKLL